MPPSAIFNHRNAVLQKKKPSNQFHQENKIEDLDRSTFSRFLAGQRYTKKKRPNNPKIEKNLQIYSK
jgi:hypothetical protein